MQERYGFVYIWYDRKHKRYYIGSHWGTENDGYVCSSPWMRRAYKRRSHDFRRRIIARICTTRKDLLKEEHYWLSMIKPKELKSKYYNCSNKEFGHWSADEKTAAEVKLKISAAPNRAQKISEAHKGKTFSIESRQRMSNSKKGKKFSVETEFKVGHTPWSKGKNLKQEGYHVSLETRQKISESLKGRPKSDETKARMTAARARRKIDVVIE